MYLGAAVALWGDDLARTIAQGRARQIVRRTPMIPEDNEPVESRHFDRDDRVDGGRENRAPEPKSQGGIAPLSRTERALTVFADGRV